MTQRYATIITDDEGREIVSTIGEFEGVAPQVRLGRVEQVAPGVRIGMVRDAAGGFCFEQPGVASQAVGLVMARLKASVARIAVAPKTAATAKPKRTKRAKRKTARSRKPARSMPKAGEVVFPSDTAAKAMDRGDG